MKSAGLVAQNSIRSLDPVKTGPTPLVSGVSIKEAARQLRRDPSTVRKWIVQGAPCIDPGTVGRGHGARVNIAALQMWQARKLTPGIMERADGDVLAVLARSFSDALKRDGAHRHVQIDEARASGFLALVFERCWMNLTMRSREEIVLPPEIRQLCAIWVQSRQYSRRD